MNDGVRFQTDSWCNPSSFGSNKSIDPPRIGVMWIFDEISLNFCVHSAAQTTTTKKYFWVMNHQLWVIKNFAHLNLQEWLNHLIVWCLLLSDLQTGIFGLNNLNLPFCRMMPGEWRWTVSSGDPWLQQWFQRLFFHNEIPLRLLCSSFPADCKIFSSPSYSHQLWKLQF